MPTVSPFPALRYDPRRIELAAVLAPPYDVIGPELQERLYSRALQNVVRVELGKDYPDDLPGERDRYTRARDHLRTWREQGLLLREGSPAVYVHEHLYPDPQGGGGHRRLGVFVAVQPAPHERRLILRHELTLDGPKEDRLRLLRATGVQASPLLLLHDGPVDVGAALEAATDRPPEAEAELRGEYGREHHRLWPVTDPDLVGPICGALSAGRMFIADGHHRYETALALRLPWALALVTPLRSADHVILATHRVLDQSPLAADQVLTALSGSGWEVATWDDVQSAQLRARELGPDHHALVVLDSEAVGTASRRRQESEHGAAQLDVSVLNREVLETILGIGPEAAAAGRVRHTRDPEEAIAAGRRRGSLSFLLNPTPLQAVVDASLAGEVLPQKSTYFYPKVPSGLVLMETEMVGPGSPRK